MKWVDRITDKIATSLGYSRVGNTERWYPIVTTDAWSGYKVTADQALRVSAVMACVRIIAETIASLPLNVYRDLAGGGKEKIKDHPLYVLIHQKPNAWQTSFELREMLQGHLCLRGNAYCRIVPDGFGRPAELDPIHPDTVTIERNANTLRLNYLVTDPTTAKTVTYDQSDILHIRGLTFDGVKGISPIQYAAESIGLAIASERFGAAFFRNGASVGNVLEHPNQLGETALKHLKESLQKEYTGADAASKTIILEEGMKWQRLGLNPEESQFIEGRKFQITDIARIFRVPPHKLADLERATFSNIEHQGIEFVTDCVRPWCVRWEQAFRRDMFAEPDVFPEFLLDGLLRGDVQARSAALAMQFQNGVLNQDEWREIENRNPIPDGSGKKFYIPLNLSNGEGGTGGNPELLGAWIDDLSGRIQAAEQRALERRASGGPYAQSFGEWVREFYSGKHAAYVRSGLGPLAGCLSMSQDASDRIIGLTLRRPLESYPSMTSDLVLDDIRTRRHDEIRTLITREVKNARPKAA